jgi:hypothetical protein
MDASDFVGNSTCLSTTSAFLTTNVTSKYMILRNCYSLLRVVNIIRVTLLIIILHLLTICITFLVITQQLSTTSTLLRIMRKYYFTQLFE